jgi:hypothetical protein
MCHLLDPVPEKGTGRVSSLTDENVYIFMSICLKQDTDSGLLMYVGTCPRLWNNTKKN